MPTASEPELPPAPAPTPTAPDASAPAAPAAPSIEIRITQNPAINYAFQQNGIAVLRELRLRNIGLTAVTDLSLRITTEPAFALPLEIRLHTLEAGAEYRTGPVDQKLSPAVLGALTERINGLLHVEVMSGEALVARHDSEIALLARNEWTGLDSLPEILAAFVLPNDPAVAGFLGQAAELLHAHTGRSALNGYQDKSSQRAWDQIAAIHAALAAHRIRYVNPPASFEQTGQKVRLPGEIASQRLATCLDLVLLFAACCEQAGLHPLVLLHKGHAYAGCWLVDRTLAEPAIDDLQTIRKLVDLEELTVFEAVAVTSDTPGTLEHSELLARPHLAPSIPFRLALDIKRARTSRIRPLPLPGSETAAATPPPGSDSSTTSTPPLPALGSRVLDENAADTDLAAPVSAASRIDQWKSRLLDLSLRNRLLNFRPTLGSVQILSPAPERVEDQLSATAEIQLRPRPSMMQARDPRDPSLHLALHGEDAVVEHLVAELALGRLHTSLPAAEHQKRLTEIFRSARASMEENGANTLFVAVGFLEWREAEHSDRTFRAPLLLVPVELRRKSVLEGFTLRRLDEEVRLNVTLMEMLRQHFHKEIAGLDPLPEDESGVNVGLVIRRFKEAVRDLAGWEVRPEVWLGQFSFSKFLLWKDLADRLDDLTRNRVVHHLVHGAGASYPNPTDDIHPRDLDRLSQPDQLFCPRSADSSQLAAVLAAAAGHDFVLEGPPGTGKSQTITNIIAHCLAHGRRVLFVAEKRAALDVVHRRLKEEGLDPFCLELHSNRAGKGEVLTQFRKTLEYVSRHEPAEWAKQVAALKTVRDELNDYVRALHQPHPCGLSAHDCFDHIVSCRELPVAKPDLPPVLTISADDLDRRRAASALLAERAAPFKSVAGHPLTPLHGTDWSGAWDEKARAEATGLATSIAPMQEAAGAIRTWLQHTDTTASRHELSTLDTIAGLLLAAPPAGAGIITTPTEPLLRDLHQWHGLALERADLRRQLTAFDEKRLLALDLGALEVRWSSAQLSWFLPKLLGSRHVRKALATASTQGGMPSVQATGAALSTSLRLREIKDALAAVAAAGTDRLGTLWNGGEPEPAALAAARTWAAELHEQLSKLTDGDQEQLQRLRSLLAATLAEGAGAFAPGAPVGKRLTAFRECWRSFDTALAAYASTVVLDRSGIDASADHAGAVVRLLQEVTTGWRDIRYWCAWQRARVEALGLGLGPILTAVERGETAPAEVPALFERSFRHALFHATLDAEATLREFFGHEHETRIRRFRELDERSTALTRELIGARLAAAIPHDQPDEASPGSELGLLRKELAKRTRYMPVRQLLGRIPGLLPRLKPCVLMSPLSVAQYLAPAHEHFDVVVFDEASQIPVWDAVGAIARGRQLVVVGDPKQLPPTNFFNRSDHPEEEDELTVETEDLESILDELLSHGLRHKRLTWHYRSLHESLIAFSNRNYYENSLLTFPSPDTTRGGIHFHRVEGASYDKGESRTNRAEASALVAELVRRLRDPAGAALSYGVVTFSQAQQDLIENLLDEQRREFPEIEEHFGDEPPIEGEPVFVKNLENVQGDERDVILFSICYGPDTTGSVSMNFGPLNRGGGERRLNVAITRARREIAVFTTLRGDDIDLTRTRARGVRDLKYFLDYAERGTSALSAVATAGGATTTAPTAFEQLVASRLRDAGHVVHHKVGSSECRVDLAVVDPTAPGRYILGIACDGPGYAQSATARDRDLLRGLVLDRLGWKLHRMWTTDWWHDADREMERLLAAIAAVTPPPVAPAEPAAPEVEPKPDSEPESKITSPAEKDAQSKTRGV